MCGVGPAMAANIFISFASQDLRVATTLCKALESRGFKCWISARDIQPGDNFQVAIVQAIRQAKIMLLVFTANSNNSEEMNKELALASQNKLIVMPLRIEDVRPNDAFAYEFATRQWIDFFADWEMAIEQLAQRIENATRDTSAEVTAEPVTPAVAASPEPVVADTPAPIEATPAEEPRTFAAAEPEDVTVAAPRDDAPAPPRRTGLYIALSLVALLVVGGLAAPSLFRSKTHNGEPKAMVVIAPAATSPQPPIPPAAPVADPGATPVDPATLADKPAPKKKKAKSVDPADEVPY